MIPIFYWGQDILDDLGSLCTSIYYIIILLIALVIIWAAAHLLTKR